MPQTKEFLHSTKEIINNLQEYKERKYLIYFKNDKTKNPKKGCYLIRLV